VHALGHIVGGKLVSSPMDELLLTATRGVNIYHGDQNALPGRVHLGRSLGGPAMNLLAGLGLLALTPGAGAGPGEALLARVMAVNLFMGVGSFLPIPSVDGAVIWREVVRWLRGFQVR
jgi:Zn-dependent protease